MPGVRNGSMELTRGDRINTVKSKFSGIVSPNDQQVQNIVSPNDILPVKTHKN